MLELVQSVFFGILKKREKRKTLILLQILERNQSKSWLALEIFIFVR